MESGNSESNRPARTLRAFRTPLTWTQQLRTYPAEGVAGEPNYGNVGQEDPAPGENYNNTTTVMPLIMFDDY